MCQETKRARPKHYSHPECTHDWCSRWNGGRVELCTECDEWNQQRYPQGWRGYPGDKCRHGTYTGGCGVDWTCSRCEFPEDDEE